MSNETLTKPDHTAVRVALWRALHAQVDAAPHVLEDVVGLRIAAPEEGWEKRPDMHPEGTKLFRASIVARARFIEDLVEEQAGRGVDQYVILGAGLDTFAQRRPAIGARVRVFEVDQPGTQAWKRRRLLDLGFGVPDWLRLVPVDFEAGASLWDELAKGGFDAERPAVVSSTGVSMYLTREANLATMKQIAALAAGSTFAMTFMLRPELFAPELKEGFERSAKGARAGGTPFISFFSPQEAIELAREAGFREARHVPASELAERYFTERSDGLRTVSGEEMLVATT